MSLITWNQNEYSVQVEEIDDQHKVLVDLINDLHNAMLNRSAKDAMGEILEKLIEYTDYHFKNEETYFDKFNYTFNSEHKRLHKSFVDKMLDFQKDFKADKLFLSSKIMNFLKDWLLKHIKVEDKKYTKLFNENGIN